MLSEIVRTQRHIWNSSEVLSVILLLNETGSGNGQCCCNSDKTSLSCVCVDDVSRRNTAPKTRSSDVCVNHEQDSPVL